MSKISTYANATPVTLSDKFIGTEVAGTPVNVTKNFLISDLLTLFQSNITLQNVLDAGNTATQSITLTGNISLDGGNLTLGSTASLYVGGLLIDSTGATGALGQTLTSDASGNPVWGSGGGGSQNLEQVLAVGNTATNNINLTGNLNLTGNIVETGDIGLTGNIIQTGGNYNLTGNLTQTGDITLTGDYGQTGAMRLTGGMVHAGSYQYSAGQFTMTASGTMVLGGALTCNSSVSLTGTVKDYTDTLGADGQVLVSNASGQVTWQSTVPSTTTTVDAASDPSANADVIFYSATSGGGTIYLDSPLNVAGRKVVLVRTSTTAAANIGANGGSVNGVAAKPLPTILYSTTTCVSDGTDWYCSNGQTL